MASNQRGLVQKNIIPRKPYFVGFNTVNQPLPPYSMTNVDLVKRDILNQPENLQLVKVGELENLDFLNKIFSGLEVS